jgi:fructoselysine-6-P-deglycase FrlB-like protein
LIVTGLQCAEMNETAREIESQPACWVRSIELLAQVGHLLPRSGQRVAVVGCGTSYYMAQAYAWLRQAGDDGPTDAFPASEMPSNRRYDSIVAISRSGTTTEVARLLAGTDADRTLAISAVPGSPVVKAAGKSITLEFADERSVVQTRFATSVLALLRAHLGEHLSVAVDQAESAVTSGLPANPSGFDHFVFLGHGWTVGIANEAALKMREAAGAHTESYPAMEYRHGPISLAGPSTLVWILDSPDPAVADDVRSTGATVVTASLDPMAELVLIQRATVALALARGLDPDAPRNLTRSVVLP